MSKTAELHYSNFVINFFKNYLYESFTNEYADFLEKLAVAASSEIEIIYDAYTDCMTTTDEDSIDMRLAYLAEDLHDCDIDTYINNFKKVTLEEFEELSDSIGINDLMTLLSCEHITSKEELLDSVEFVKKGISAVDIAA